VRVGEIVRKKALESRRVFLDRRLPPTVEASRTASAGSAANIAAARINGTAVSRVMFLS